MPIGIIAHYRMNDNAANSTVLDVTGNHNGNYKDSSGNINTDTGSTTAKVDRGLDFDGTDEYIEIADHADFTPILTPFSISMWVYMHNATYFVWASKWQVGSNQEWNIFTGTQKKIHFRMYDDSENAYIGRAYNTSLTENQWTHFVTTYDGGTLSSGIKIHLNGNRVDDADSESNASSFDAVENLNAPVYIGRYDTKYADGLIDNVMFFERELSAREIERQYQLYLPNRGRDRDRPRGKGKYF